jgi:hypothetical protein
MNRLLSHAAVLVAIATTGCAAADEEERWGSSEFFNTETDAACPEGVTCIDDAGVAFTEVNTTERGRAVFDSYSCAPDTDESGHEMVYRIDVETEGLLVASVEGLAAGVDVDIHILDKLQPGSCIDRGDQHAATLAEPGRYWVVVDSYSDGNDAFGGRYQLSIALTTADDHADSGLHPDVLEAGIRAFSRGWLRGETERLEYGIIDYGMPSTEERFFVLDLASGALLHRELTTHGESSGDPNDATKVAELSNVNDSHKSSIGLVRAAETYYGNHGYSMRMDGLEPGYNDNDRSRAIVVHKADYATQAFVDANGYLGRSWGCPAVAPSIYKSLIGDLKDGALMLKYFDDSDWLARSDYVAP